MHRELVLEEKHKFIESVNDYFGSRYSTDCRLFLKNEKKNVEKIFLYSGSILPTLPLEWVGLHFVTLNETGIVPSIEGAQLIGTTATKNVVEICRDDVLRLYQGVDEVDCIREDGILILKSEGIIIGSGLVRENKLKNLLPISRRLLRYVRNKGNRQ